MKIISESVEAFGLRASLYSKSHLFPGCTWVNELEKILEVVSLDTLFFPFPWSRKAWLDLDEVSEDYALVVLESDSSQVIAFSLWSLSHLDELAHLLKIIVIPEWRGKSLGVSLLQLSLNYFGGKGLTSFYLEVEEGNVSARQVYEKLGFEILHKARNYYGSGRNGVKMGKIFE